MNLASWKRYALWFSLLWVLSSGTFLASKMSMTTDEGIHVASGYLAITRQDHRFDPEHPFLFKYLSALPLVILHPNLPPGDEELWQAARPTLYDSWKEAREWTDRWFYKSSNNADLMIFLARLPGVLVLLALCYGVYLAGKRWFSEEVGLLALFFTAFNPTLLAHGSLANTDVPVAAAFIWSLLALWHYGVKPSWRTAVWVALSIAAVLLTKISGIAILPIAFIWLIYIAWGKKLGWMAAAHGGVAALIIWAAIWTVYLFRSPVYFTGDTIVDPLLHLQMYLTSHNLSAEIVSRTISWFLPSAYLKGVFLVGFASSFGRETYILNTVYRSGVWFYFPVVFFLKTQLVGSILFFTGLGLSIGSFKRRGWSPAGILLTLAAAILILVSVKSKLNLGIRHISPLLPLFSIFIALTLSQLRRLFIPIYFYLGILALYALPVFVQLPALFSFSNLIVSPYDHAYLYYDDSNLDWGQQAEALAMTAKTQFPGEEYYTAYFWNPYALQYFGLDTKIFEPTAPPDSGIVIITATQLARDPNYQRFRAVTPAYTLANHTFFYRAADLAK